MANNYNGLKDILNEELSLERNIFNHYKDKKIIGEYCLADFKQKYAKNNRRGNVGFYLSDFEKSTVGLITQCRGLLSMFELSKFGVDIHSDKELVSMINQTLNDISITIQDKNNSYKYDATPYLDFDEEDENRIHCYTDSLALIVETMIEAREAYYNNLENEQFILIEGFPNVIERIEDILHKAIQKLIDSSLGINVVDGVPQGLDYTLKGDRKVLLDKNGQKCLYRGWTYQDMPLDSTNATETSIYFTYVACKAYLTLYNALEEAIKYSRDFEYKPNCEKEKLERDLKFLEKIQVAYNQLNKRCYDAGHYIDLMTRTIDISSDFVGYGFKAVTIKDINSSTSNDALFNTLFCISIFVMAGVDLDYKAIGKYEEFLEALQFAIQNVQKTFKNLKNNNKEYIVEQLVLPFNEKIDNSKERIVFQTKTLRKKKIQVLTLVPLLIKTYTMISKYLVQYPQTQMTAYLQMILDNRIPNKWLWDKDGYNITTNYYYISSLLDFYTYYEKFEYPFATRETDILNAADKKVEEERIRSEEKMAFLMKQFEAKEKEWKEQLDVIRNTKPAVVNELENLSKGVLKENIKEVMVEMFQESADFNCSETNDKNIPINNAFKDYLISFFFDSIKQTYDRSSIEPQEMEALKKHEISEKDLKAYKVSEKTLMRILKVKVADLIKIELGIK